MGCSDLGEELDLLCSAEVGSREQNTEGSKPLGIEPGLLFRSDSLH